MDEKLLQRMKNLMKNSEKIETHYDCEVCRDLGYTFVQNEVGYDVAVPCSCLAKKQSLEKLDKCGLSNIFRKKTFHTYTAKKPFQIKAKHQALKFCDEFLTNKSSILLCGKPGTGKTHLGIAVMLNLINKNIGCKYVEYNNMIMSLKQSVMDEENFMREMEHYLNPSVLFIDDFLKGKITSADLNYIYRIINSRYLKNKPLIISTEKSIESIISWDEAVGSRLVEMSQGNIINFNQNSENYRMMKYKK